MSEVLSKKPQENPKSFDELNDRFSQPVNNYERLRGDVQTVRERTNVWDTDTTLERYVSSTDHIVGILDGSIGERALFDPDDPERSTEKPDVVIWLDKSARPVSWFVDDLWEQMSVEGSEKPAYEFLNIDRANWFKRLGHSEEAAESRLGPTDFDIDKVQQEDIDRLRAYFSNAPLNEENWREEVWKHDTRLDGKNILIVDEVKNLGGTLAIAQQLLKRAIPELTVSGEYFWQAGRYSLDGINAGPNGMQMESAPVWYSKNNVYGRGVGEVSNDYYTHLYETDPTPENLKKKLAWFALSAPHYDPLTYEDLPDSLANRLRQDIAYVSYALGEGRILRAPSAHRDINQFKDILQKQGLTLEEYKEFREKREQSRGRRRR